MARPRTTAMLWLGLALLVVGTPTLGWLHHERTETRRSHEALAVARDRIEARLALKSCTVKLRGIETDGRVRSVGEAFNVTVTLENTTTSTCTTQLTLSASSFDLAPDGPMELVVAPGVRPVLWNLTPKHPGEQAIIVTAGTEQREVGFYIEDTELLPEWTLLAGSIASFLFGPMLTVPWWLERRRRRQEAAEEAAREEKRPRVGFQ